MDKKRREIVKEQQRIAGNSAPPEKANKDEAIPKEKQFPKSIWVTQGKVAPDTVEKGTRTNLWAKIKNYFSF